MHPPLHGWEAFYVIIGSSAAALTGLQFVVVALLSDSDEIGGGEEEMNAFATPTIVHFCAVLLIAAICSTPEHSALTLAACLILSGGAALVYQLIVVSRARRSPRYKPVLEDWIWHAVLPMIAYAMLLLAGILELRSPAAALYPVAASALLLLYIGIHNAWDTATFISVARKGRHSAPKAPASSPPSSPETPDA